jgi:hypothetical protein
MTNKCIIFHRLNVALKYSTTEISSTILKMEDRFSFDRIVLEEYKEPQIVLIMVPMELCMRVR